MGAAGGGRDSAEQQDEHAVAHERAGAEAARKLDGALVAVTRQPWWALLLELALFVAAMSYPWKFEKTSLPDALFQSPGFTLLAQGAAGVLLVASVFYLVRSIAARVEKAEFATQAAGVAAEQQVQAAEDDLADAKDEFGELKETVGEALEVLERSEDVHVEDERGETVEPASEGEPSGRSDG